MSHSLATVGVIARRYDVPLHRVEYVVRSRGICPAALAGNARVFSDEAVELIGIELQRIKDDRENDPGTTLNAQEGGQAE